MSDTQESLSLMEFLQELIANVQLRDWFTMEPEAALEHYGLDNLTPADVHDALVLIEDNQTADFSRDYDTGSGSVAFTAPSYAGDDHEAAIEYLNTYITNNYVDDRDTTVDSSLNQHIDTRGGDFDQDLDIDQVTASGDGAIAAGGDIEDSTLVTGDGNQVGGGDGNGNGNVNGNGDGNVVGDGNQAVTGHGDTTSFGSGGADSTDVGGHLDVGDGAAFATGGEASADNFDNSRYDVDNDYSDNSVVDSGNDRSDSSQQDVGSDVSDNSDNSDNSLDDADDNYSDNSDDSQTTVGDVDVDF